MTAPSDTTEWNKLDQEVAGEAAVQSLFVNVRRRFRVLEREQGLSQQQLADRMEVPRSQISRWFSSPSNMTLRSAAKILMAMGRKLELADVDPRGAAVARDAPKKGATIHAFLAHPPVQLALAAAHNTQSADRNAGGFEPVAMLARGPAEGRLVFRDSDVFLELPADEAAKRLRLGSVGYDLEPAAEGLLKVLGLKPGEARRACKAAQDGVVSWA